jgi:WhiB family transcriptional regulator, redox-sensing transcriptional regulator
MTEANVASAMITRPAGGRQRDAEAGHWTERGACREPGTDPELFFPVGETGLSVGQVAAAKAVCARCPVTDQCRDWAVRTGEREGIWGGTTPEERRHLRRRRLRVA